MSTPSAQRLTTQFSAAAYASPADVPTTADKAVNSSKATNRESAEAALDSAAAGSAQQDGNSRAQLDELAAEHPHQVAQGPAHTPAPATLTDSNMRLAELHAHIIAGAPCNVMLIVLHNASLAVIVCANAVAV